MALDQYSIPFAAIDNAILDADETRPLFINRSPEPYETAVLIDSCVYVEVADVGDGGVDADSVRVNVNGTLAYSGSGGFSSGFNGPLSGVGYVGNGDTLAVQVDPEVEFSSLSLVNVRVYARTLDGQEATSEYTFEVEDKTSPVLLSVTAWGQSAVRVVFGNPFVESPSEGAVSVVGYMPWGPVPFAWDSDAERWVVGELTYPYASSATGPFALENLDYLDVSIDGGVEQRVTFKPYGFVSIGSATAQDVASYISSALVGASAEAVDGRVWLRSLSSSGSVRVLPGKANAALGFETSLRVRALPYDTVEYHESSPWGMDVYTTYSDGRVGHRRESVSLLGSMPSLSIEPESEALSVSSALAASNYSIERRNVLPYPAVNVVVESVAQVSTNTVQLELDIPMTPGAPYALTVAENTVSDAAGNGIRAPYNTAEFSGWTPNAVVGRDFSLWDMLPNYNRENDDGDLQKLVLCKQEVVDLVLHDTDCWTRIHDPAHAAEPFVDAMLRDLGNPFDWMDLSLARKRLLVNNLVPLYKLRGSSQGIERALLLLMDLHASVVPYSDSTRWVLGDSTRSSLGVTTTLGQTTRRARLSFDVEMDEIDGNGVGGIGGQYRALTASELSDARRIVKKMKPANMHLGRVLYPVPATEQYGWSLGVSVMGGSSPASVTSNEGPFALHDGDTLSFVVNGTTRTVSFDSWWFDDVSSATASEVAAFVNRRLAEWVFACEYEGRLQVQTLAAGASATILAATTGCAAVFGFQATASGKSEAGDCVLVEATA